MLSNTLPLAEEHTGTPFVPASVATVWTGFLMLTTRKRAIMQVLGDLLLENGSFLFGVLRLEAMPFVVEVETPGRGPAHRGLEDETRSHPEAGSATSQSSR